jgi:putative SOS response-associated peptidase YedK
MNELRIHLQCGRYDTFGNSNPYLIDRATALNAVVEPIHHKAMPVILTTDEERDVWMRSHGFLPKSSSSNDCKTTPAHTSEKKSSAF